MATKEVNEDELEFVDEVSHELLCTICKRVLYQPHMVNCCGKSFCLDCLEAWMEDNGTCPHCRSAKFTYMFMMQKERKIRELKVYCLNKRHGCNAELRISECGDHISPTNENGCLYVKMDCPNKCGTEVFRGQMLEHKLKLCSKRIITCVHCKLKGQYQQLMTEHVGKCPLRPVHCPRNCGTKVAANKLQAHQSECPLEPIACSFRALGCKVQTLRKDLKDHIESNSGLSHHLSILVKSFTTLQTEHAVLRVDHSALNGACSMLQKEYATLQNKHTTLQNKHTALQREHSLVKMLCSKTHEEFQSVLSDNNATLKESYSSLEKKHQALSTKHNRLESELTTLKSLLVSLQNNSADRKQQLRTDSKHVKHKPLQNRTVETGVVRMAAKEKVGTAARPEKWWIGNSFTVQILEEPVHHNFTLMPGNIKLRLEWEKDDLFLKPENISYFEFRLYHLKTSSTTLGNVDVMVSSDSGDSGLLVVVCCGKPQTILWEMEEREAIASAAGGLTKDKILLGNVHLECMEAGSVVVSLSHHKRRHCKCTCHLDK